MISNVKNHPAIAVILGLSIAILLYVFATNNDFFNWAFHRHQNTLSWWARPILVLPLCFFSYKRSLNGILLSILAIFTSMFWFPAPKSPDPDVLAFLNMEKEFLAQGWTGQNIVAALLVISFFIGISVALWRRSIIQGLSFAVLGAIGKGIWSLWANPDIGDVALIYAAAGALLPLIAAFLYVLYYKLIRPTK